MDLLDINEPGMTTTTSMTSLGEAAAAVPSGGDDSDFDINRRDIAMGVTPVAARESAFKFLMSQKEQQVKILSNNHSKRAPKPSVAFDSTLRSKTSPYSVVPGM